MGDVRKFVVKVNGNEYEVEVEEIMDNCQNDTSESNVTSTSQGGKLASSSILKNADVKVTTEIGSGKVLGIKAPMPGVVRKINVKVGDLIKKGDVAVILEAMKMENELVAPADGRIISIFKNENDMVNAGDMIISLDYDLQKVKGGKGLWQK